MGNKQARLDLGSKPVVKLLVQYALPAMFEMTAASLYNIVDRVFIGQGVGAMAISGLAITFPFMNLTAAFGAGVGVGASTAISVKLGQKDYATAQNILGNTISLNLIIGIGLSIICLLFLDPILRFFGASDQTLIYAHEYMVIILLGNVVSHMYFGMNALPSFYFAVIVFSNFHDTSEVTCADALLHIYRRMRYWRSPVYLKSP